MLSFKMLKNIKNFFRKKPWAYIIIFFLCVFAANAVLVTLAVKSWRGLANKNAYEDGINYNQALSKKQAEKALGWQTTIAFIPTAPKQGTLELTLKNQQNQPINNARISAKIIRPITEGHDFTLNLAPQNNGLYSIPLTVPMHGQWEVKLTITQGTSTLQARKRLIIK